MNGLLKPLMDALAKAVSDPANPIVGYIAKWLLHTLGDKTSSLIGGVIAWLLAHADITTAIGSVLPDNVAHYVAIAVPYLVVIFAGYITTPKKGAAIVSAINAAPQS